MKTILILSAVVAVLTFTDFFDAEEQKDQEDTANTAYQDEAVSDSAVKPRSENRRSTEVDNDHSDPTPSPSPDQPQVNDEKAAEYDLIMRLQKMAREFRGAKPGNVEDYKAFALVYVYRAQEFTSNARGSALLCAQTMLFTGAGSLELQDEPASAFELYALAEAVAAIANDVVQDNTCKNLIAKHNQDFVIAQKRGLLAGRLRNISRELLQFIYDGNFKRVYRVYNHEEEPREYGK